MFGDEYELAHTEWDKFKHIPTKCPKCGNDGKGKCSEGGKRILEASPSVRNKNGVIVRVHIDPPPEWEDGRRRYFCCKCDYLGHAIEFKLE